jgi:hypothetical protein
MSDAVVMYILIGVLVAALALGAWLFDARRNKGVAHDAERTAPDPNAQNRAGSAREMPGGPDDRQ